MQSGSIMAFVDYHIEYSQDGDFQKQSVPAARF